MKHALRFAVSFSILCGVACGGEIQPEPTLASDEAEGAIVAESRPSARTDLCGVDEFEDFEECQIEGESGLRQCRGGVWSVCGRLEDCRPDGSPANACAVCALERGVWRSDDSKCSQQSSSTPLVLSFDRAPVRFTHPSGSFDVVGRNVSIDTDWVSAATPWLAVDRDGNGSIDDGSELFGSMSRLPDGRRAEHGFVALASLDENADGRIDARDSGFASLVLWRDANQDRRSQRSELTAAMDEGLLSIDLGFHRETRCVGSACEVERATFEFADPARRGVRTGDIVDVHFVH